MNHQIRSTGIEVIDARVKEIMQLPKRLNILDAPFDENFPGRTITRDVKSEIIVVGAGWEFPFHATAFVAAGARITAYEMTTEKLGAGQIGINMKNNILGFHRARTLAHLMPDFTPEHLGKLPDEIRDIMNLPCYQALSKKRRSIISKGFQAYRDLPDAEKMSKKEVVETKSGILEYMVAVGVLEVIYQEVTIDMVASWLKKNKPVFLMTGRQLNLEKSGLNSLIGNPRYLKEFLLDSEDTEKFLKAVSDLQRAHAASGFPSSTLPRVGIIGGGAIALSCELDLGKILQPNLEIVPIAPEKRLGLPDSLLPAQRSMKHQFVPGLKDDEVLIEKIKSLIERDPDQATIIASGNGPMVKRLIWLAASLGYRGQFFQVVLPSQDQDDRVTRFNEELESKGKFVRRPIQGRLKNAMINGEKLTLEVHDSNGEPVSDVPDVDFLVNGIGKTKRTHLINALIEKGYIHENDAARDGTGIHSCHPMLSGHYTIFQPDVAEDVITSPGLWWSPWVTTPKTEPHGWEEAFNIACKMLGKCA
ncbi:Hypothetical protein PENO1_109510 [Penicillium occitanis (nom. inval.)]|nr:Hypothetical protein PENO1_109510 [Penicillium occitanis (nom. inval.)]PCG88707.1 hypothetical protein PENOC_109740 [Penicillium occitanis (nom. inval.)]